MAGTMMERMVGASFLSIDTFEEVEHDQEATLQAAGVVAMVAVAQALGASPLGVFGAVRAALFAVVGWAVWAGVSYLLGSKLFGAEATWGEVMRTLGFAQAPGLLLILGIIPILGLPITLLVALWMLVAGFIGLRQALDVGNGKTLATVLVGWCIYAVLAVVF
jgi:hypothetical protein